MTLRQRVNQIGQRLAEAPYELPFALLAVLYAISTFCLPTQPHSVEATLPTWLVIMWACAFLLGGLLTIVGRFGYWLRTEIVGQCCIGYGLALYATSLGLHGGPSAALAVVAFAAFTVGAFARAHILAEAVKAERIAGRLRRRRRDDSP